MRVLAATSAWLARALMALAGAALVGMAILACANMVLRAFGAPIKGSYELMGFVGALAIAFGLAQTQMTRGHIALTILAGKFPRRVERGVDFVVNLCCAAFFGLAAWRTADWALGLAESGELSETLRIPYHPFPLALALGVGAMALALLCDALASLAPPETKVSRP